jgi:hypothetical protein
VAVIVQKTKEISYDKKRWMDQAPAHENRAVFYTGRGLQFTTNQFITCGDVSGGTTIKAINFWYNPDTSESYIVELSSTARIKVASGVFTLTGLSGTVYQSTVSQTKSYTGTWRQVMIDIPAGVDCDAVLIGLVQSTLYYEGKFADFQFWKPQFTQADRNYIIQNPEKLATDNPANTFVYSDVSDILLARYQLNDGSGTTAFDSSGNALDGVISNAPTWIFGQQDIPQTALQGFHYNAGLISPENPDKAGYSIHDVILNRPIPDPKGLNLVGDGKFVVGPVGLMRTITISFTPNNTDQTLINCDDDVHVVAIDENVATDFVVESADGTLIPVTHTIKKADGTEDDVVDFVKVQDSSSSVIGFEDEEIMTNGIAGSRAIVTGSRNVLTVKTDEKFDATNLQSFANIDGVFHDMYVWLQKVPDREDRTNHLALMRKG